MALTPVTPALLRLTLRLQRTGFLACAAVGATHALLQAIGYAQVAGTAEARLRFAQEMEPLSVQMSYLLPLPVRLDTLAGFVQWRVFGLLPIVFSFWALVAGTGAMRGDEERGLVEQWLGAGVSRAQLLGARLVVFGATAAAAMALVVVAAALGAAAAGEPFGAGPLLGQGATLWGLTVACYGLVLAIAQLVSTRRGAVGAGGAALLALFFLNSLSRTSAALAPYRWLSPFAYHDRTTALAPGGAFDLPATLGLVIAGAALAAMAAAGFARRDLGAPLFRGRPRTGPPVVIPSRNPLLRTPVLAGLYDQRATLFFWLFGTSLLGIFFMSVARTVVDLMQNTPSLQGYLQAMTLGGPGNPYQAFIGLSWFGILQLLLALFAVTQVSRWASEDAEGRLEMILAAPVPRRRVVLERLLALALGCALIAGAGALVAALGSRQEGMALDSAGLLLAAVLLLPLGLTFGGFGAAVAGRLPRAAVPALSAFAIAGYFVQQFGLLLRWPAWAMGLSVFHLYGAPLANGVYWTGLWALIGLSLAGSGLALVTMQRREVGS